MLCRLCVKESHDFVYLSNLYYEEIEMEQDTTTLVICNTCNHILKDFHQFYQMVKLGQEKYVTIKIEADSEYSLPDCKEKTEDDLVLEYDENYSKNVETTSVNFESKPLVNKSCKKKVNTVSKSRKTKNILNKEMLDRKSSKEINTVIDEDKEIEMETLNDNFTDSDSEPLVSVVNKSKHIDNDLILSDKCRNKSNKDIVEESNSLQRKKMIPRSRKATEAVLSKYRVEDIYSDGRWNLSQEQKDEVFALYIDMKCKECGEMFADYAKLTEHSMESHGVGAVVRCDNFSLSSYDLIERHILYKHILNVKMPRLPRARIPCKICKKLIRDCSMREHLSSHLPHHKREFQCDRCHAGFGSKGALKSHIALNHEATAMSCDDCGKNFRNVYHMMAHKRRVHSSSDRHHLCPECGREYKDYLTYTNHVNQHYGIVERVKCGVCEAVIKRSCLSSHMRAHDVTNQKQCPQCPYKGFRIREHIKRAHDKVKTRTCTLCSKQFYDVKGLKDHMASTHTGIPEYSCEWCGATFMNSGNCHSHRKKMHPQHWAQQKMDKANTLDAVDIPVCDQSTLLRNKHILEGEQAEMVIRDLKNRKKRLKKLDSVVKK